MLKKPMRPVVLEVPAAWLQNHLDGARHRELYASLLLALSEMNTVIIPVTLPLGADQAPRDKISPYPTISFHSWGAGENIVRLKEGYIPPYYVADRHGYSGFSELANNPEKFIKVIDSVNATTAKIFVESLRDTLISTNTSKYPQASPQSFRAHGPYVFFPLQTVDDPVARHAYLDQLVVLENLLEYYSRSNYSVVVKRHPFCRSVRVKNKIKTLSCRYNNLHLTTASIHDIIPGSDYVIGANSGVLFEALLYRKHVVSFARSDFSVLTKQFCSVDEMFNLIERITPFTDSQIDRFLYWYLNCYCIRANDIPSIKKKLVATLELEDHHLDIHAPRVDIINRFANNEIKRRQMTLDVERNFLNRVLRISFRAAKKLTMRLP